MDYVFDFVKENCWYKNVCKKYNTEECNDSCIRYREMHYLFSTSNLPKNKWYPFSLVPDEVDYDSFVKLDDLKNNILSFVMSGKSLYLFSKNMGNGKTSWSIKLLQSYFNKIWANNGFKERATFIHVPTFLRLVTESVKSKTEEFEELKDRLINDDLVIWDDIASTKMSDFDYKYLLSFIDKRILEGKSNIYTGNFNKLELDQNIGRRLSSRIYNDSIVIELMGRDRRGEDNDRITSYK